jgi:tetratricopeptide (TPR) repeat protein
MAMERYREVLGAYPDTAVAGRLRKVVKIRELESKGRELYKSFRFAEAKAVFAEIAAADPEKKARMDFFEALCLYGQGLDDAALARAREVARSASEPSVRAEATLWVAKFLFNRGEWKESGELFRAYAAADPGGASLPDALVWAARAAFSGGDFNGAIQSASDLARLRPDSPQTVQALTVQGEALIELARFDEAVLVLERASHSENAPAHDRIRALLLKADALFATGADNPARYLAALETYRSVLFGGTLDASAGICVSFKIAKVLEKLKRTEEAVDQYYSQVVLAYRRYRLDGVRLDDDARAAFSRAAFRLADEFEGRGRDYQAIRILELVAASDVPAAGEAEKRIGRINMKGGFQ